MKNRQLLLTGGTGALGRSVIPLAIQRGAQIVIPYISKHSLEQLRRHLGSKSLERVEFVKCNLTIEEEIQKIFIKLKRIDILIHLAGGFSMGPSHEYSIEKWQQQIDLNLTSTFLVCKYSLRHMREQNYGRIVTIASRAAVEPAGEMAAYCASKAGVVALTKSIADETKGTNITANVVLPSIIDTPANRKNMGEQDADKWVNPDSLAQVILFLASKQAKDIRGSAIPVYGNV